MHGTPGGGGPLELRVGDVVRAPGIVGAHDALQDALHALHYAAGHDRMAGGLTPRLHGGGGAAAAAEVATSSVHWWRRHDSQRTETRGFHPAV